jgi:hypothetical protein
MRRSLDRFRREDVGIRRSGGGAVHAANITMRAVRASHLCKPAPAPRRIVPQLAGHLPPWGGSNAEASGRHVCHGRSGNPGSRRGFVCRTTTGFVGHVGRGVGCDTCGTRKAGLSGVRPPVHDRPPAAKAARKRKPSSSNASSDLRDSRSVRLQPDFDGPPDQPPLKLRRSAGALAKAEGGHYAS